MSAGTGRAEGGRDLADAVRDLIHRMVATKAPAEVFEGLADDLRAAAARFEPYPKQYLFEGVHEAALADAAAVAEDYQGPFDLSPLMGRANPLAPPMQLEVQGKEVIGTVTFGSAYEGPPGCVHGGFVAAAFDELLGLVQIVAGNPGMTGRLTVHYRSPTPLHEELRLEGHLVRMDGRKNICKGEIYAGDRLCAEAEGLFIKVDFSKIAALAEAAKQRMA